MLYSRIYSKILYNTVLKLPNGLQDDDGDLAFRLQLVLLEGGDGALLEVPVPFPLVALGHPGDPLDDVRPHLDGGLGEGHQVVVPIGVPGRPATGGEHDEDAVDRQVDEGILPRLTTPGPNGVEDQQGDALEVAADPAPLGAEALDSLLVPGVDVRHRVPPRRRRSRRRTS